MNYCNLPRSHSLVSSHISIVHWYVQIQPSCQPLEGSRMVSSAIAKVSSKSQHLSMQLGELSPEEHTTWCWHNVSLYQWKLAMKENISMLGSCMFRRFVALVCQAHPLRRQLAPRKSPAVGDFFSGFQDVPRWWMLIPNEVVLTHQEWPGKTWAGGRNH